MNTKIIMTVSTLFLGIMGFSFSFLPKEILILLNIDFNQIIILLFQLLGALYLGFSILNWMAKGTLIGGIYNKPIAIGNFMHFAVGAITLIKIVLKIETHSEIIISLTVIYTLFALSFAYIFMNNPVDRSTK
jgi:hypothetical protein